LKIIPLGSFGPTAVSDGEILTTTFGFESDGAEDGDNPILVTFSINPDQHDPEDLIDALRILADLLDEAIDSVDTEDEQQEGVF
jgi:hypothetical protein